MSQEKIIINTTSPVKTKIKNKSRKNKSRVKVKQNQSNVDVNMLMKQLELNKSRNKKKNKSFSTNVTDDSRIARRALGAKALMNDCSKSWLARYNDPCGEEVLPLQELKIPDGAITMSAALQFRFVDTVFPPFISRSNVDVTGKNYSMLVLRPPSLRIMATVLVNRLGQEFGQANLDDFFQTFNSLPSDQGIFPDWVGCQNTILIDGNYESVQYFTRLSTNALLNLQIPTEAGISADVSQYRFTTDGMTIMHNTPTLFNQGTAIVGQFNANIANRTLTHDSAINPLYLTGLVTSNAILATQTSVFSSNPQVLVDNVVLGSDNSIISGPAPPYTATHRVVNKAGTPVVVPGDTYRYEYQTLPSPRVSLFNITTSSSTLITTITGLLPGASTSNATRLYFTTLEDDTPVPDHETILNLVAMPAITQQQIAQADPKFEAQLLKTAGGVYVPGVVFEPVFNMQAAANYHRTIFSNSKADIEDLEVNPDGYSDSFDKNFGFQVVNMQSVPYACALLFKIFRSIELVPTENSVYAPVSLNAPQEDEIALNVAREISNTNSHGYPANYNLFGLLFKKVLGILSHLPRHAATVATVAQCVQDAAATVQSGAEKISAATL